ncbi:hypothetical protein [Undibacterium sp. WLX3042]|uniref:hypothetical protein n=1 Tax=Undibacterium sp. WLX3042 TaxID=3412686 RepID=UPI003C2D9B4C
MSKKFIGTVLCLAITTLTTPSFAQFGGLGNVLGGSSNSSNSVSAETLVQSYVGGTQHVMSADVNLLKAMGLKEQAEREELAAKNLTQGATASGLEDAAKVQTDSSKALEEAMGAKKVTMSADSKKLYVAGVVDLVKGIKSYTGMANDVKNFKPSITSIGSSAGAASYVIKSLPNSITGLKDTLKRTIDFAKENKIALPADATSVL